MSGEDERVGREVAYRLFAAEYDDATLSHTESDDDRAPNYVITPTGARVNRLFIVGTLTEVSRVNEEMVRARVVDPTGAFVVYAGQYQPEALAFLEGAEPPAFVAVTGKARTFEPDDGDRIYTSVRPESMAVVDADTRDRWVVTTAERTDERIGTIAAAATEDARDEELATLLQGRGVETGLASGIPLALAHYGTTPDYLAALSELTTDAVRVIAGDLEEVPSFDITPSGEGETEVGYTDLAGLEDEPVTEEAASAMEAATEGSTAGSEEPAGVEASEVEPASGSGESEPTEPVGTEPASADEGEMAEPGTDNEGLESELASAGTESDPGGVGETEPNADTEPASGTEPEPGVDSEEPGGAGPEVESGTEEAAAEPAVEANVGTSADAGGNGDGGDDTETAADLEGEAGMYEMDDEERAEIEDEFGAEFTTGTDVEEPGEADIEAPDPDDLEEGEGVEEEPLGDFDSGGEEFSDTEGGAEADSEPAPDAAAEPDAGVGSEAADAGVEDVDESDEEVSEDEDVDLEAYAVETMQNLDAGDGADREAVVERVASETGADEGEVESAIDDALMSGQCYEPNDGTLKAI